MTKIHYQKNLMKKALKKLYEIDTLRSVLKKIDPTLYSLKSEKIKKEYANIMANLKVELFSIKDIYPTFLRNLEFSEN